MGDRFNRSPIAPGVALGEEERLPISSGVYKRGGRMSMSSSSSSRVGRAAPAVLSVFEYFVFAVFERSARVFERSVRVYVRFVCVFARVVRVCVPSHFVAMFSFCICAFRRVRTRMMERHSGPSLPADDGQYRVLFAEDGRYRSCAADDGR